MRPKTITVAPPLPDDDAFATKQQPSASGFILMTSGAAKTQGADRDALCLAQTLSAAGELTMNGAFACSNLDCPRVVTIYATIDLSARTFTIRGTSPANGRHQVDTISGPNNSTVRSSKVFSAVLQVHCNNTITKDAEVGFQAVGTPSEACRVKITASQDESGVSYTLHGRDQYGRYRTETGTLPNATIQLSMRNYDRIIGLDLSSACASIIQPGTATQAESKWVPVDRNSPRTLVDVQLFASADFEHSVQWTAEDIRSTEFAASRQLPTSPFVHTVTETATTVSANYILEKPMTAVRLAVDSYASGKANMRIVQERPH